MSPAASVIIPAHNEAAVIRRLLVALTTGSFELEIIVVCNGCTDATAEIASGFAPSVQVIEIAQPSKQVALRRGDSAAHAFPRLYIDADVEISADAVQQLVAALAVGPPLAAAPARHVPREGASLFVRWYYDVWEQLPQVRSGLFGRGVIALSEPGNVRVRALPALMGDDLAASEVFTPNERAVVSEAVVVVWPPRTGRDLVKRRIRTETGNSEADRVDGRHPGSITTPRTLLTLIRERPVLIPKMPVFLGVAVAARVGARRAFRRGDTDTWLRDESSRQVPTKPSPDANDQAL